MLHSCLLALVGLSVKVVPAQVPQRRVIVYPLRAEAALAPVAAHLTEEVLLSLEGLQGLKVLGHAELNLLLTQIKARDCQGADAKDCMSKMLSLADADQVVTGSLSKMGDHFLGTLSLLSSDTLTHIKSESFLVEQRSELEQTARQKARALFEAAPARSKPHRLVCSQGKACKVALFPMERYGTQEGLAASVAELLSLQLKRAQGLSVISHHEIETIIKYKVEQRICFGDANITECLQLVRSVVDTDYAVLSALSKLEDTFIIVLKLVKLKQEEGEETLQVTRRVLEPYRGSKKGLAKAIEFAAAELLGQPIEGQGALSVKTQEVVEAKMHLDAKGEFVLPMKAPMKRLFAGRHQVAILAEGYERFDQEVYVSPKEVTQFEVKLTALPTPWYKSWWFWTTTAVVVAGAAAGTTAYLILDEPKGGPGVVEF